MTKIADITDAMMRYNGSVAYGSECNAWQDYVDDCRRVSGKMPWDEWQNADGEFVANGDTDAPDDFAVYWLAVADGKSTDYTPESGSKT